MFIPIEGIHKLCLQNMGPFRNDVSREGEVGGTKNLTQQGRLCDFSNIDWSKMLTWGEGSKSQKFS